jgi:hypothetical protein
VEFFATGWQKDLIKMCRSAHFVVKFLLRFFQKADGGVWGGTPTDTAFLFLELFFLRLRCQRKKAAKWAGRLRENEMRNEE